MPSFPPGTPNNVSVTPIPLQVFTPTPGVQASCRFWNPGSGIVYVGGANVSPANGLPIIPGNRPVDLQNVNVNLYACAGVGAVATTGALSAANAAGATSWTVTTAAPTVGTYIRVGNGTGVEYLYVTAVSGAATPWTATTSTASLYDHASGSSVATVVNSFPGPLSVQAGVV
jgi:hypothetical protein